MTKNDNDERNGKLPRETTSLFGHAEAERALQLDEQMPHKEKKLSRQYVGDPQDTPAKTTLTREETAEQTVQRLRTSLAEDRP